MKKPFILLTLLLAAGQIQAAPKCRTLYSDDSYDNTKICRYRNTNVARVYRQYRQNQLAHLPAEQKMDALLPNMPRQITKMPRPSKESGLVETVYTPRKNGLHIEQFFEGGINTIIFTQRGKDVEVKTISSPD